MWLLYCVIIISSLVTFFFVLKENIKRRKMEQGGRRRKDKESAARSLLVLEKDRLRKGGWTTDNARLVGRRLDGKILMMKIVYKTAPSSGGLVKH